MANPGRLRVYAEPALRKKVGAAAFGVDLHVRLVSEVWKEQGSARGAPALRAVSIQAKWEDSSGKQKDCSQFLSGARNVDEYFNRRAGPVVPRSALVWAARRPLSRNARATAAAESVQELVAEEDSQEVAARGCAQRVAQLLGLSAISAFAGRDRDDHGLRPE